jgi:ribosomal protein L37AE/L43A
MNFDTCFLCGSKDIKTRRVGFQICNACGLDISATASQNNKKTFEETNYDINYKFFLANLTLENQNIIQTLK